MATDTNQGIKHLVFVAVQIQCYWLLIIEIAGDYCTWGFIVTIQLVLVINNNRQIFLVYLHDNVMVHRF